MNDLQCLYEGDLGGCVVSEPNGDPATWCPKLWDWLIQTTGVYSVLDIGCGVAFSTRYFEQQGCEAVGIEGCQEAIDKSVASHLVRKHDFRDGHFTMPCGIQFNLGWCAEVVEHIDPEYEKNLLLTLGTCRIVAMTHGFPGQGGHHHVNLQWPSYWIDKMYKMGFKLDITLTRQGRMISRFEYPGENHFARSGLVFRHRPPKECGDNLLLTWASGSCCESPEMKVFLNTVGVAPADKVVFTHDMSLEARERFKTAGFEIIDIDPNRVSYVNRDRFYFYQEYLEQYQAYKKVFLVDSRDILFLGNPVEWIDNHLDGKPLHLLLASEGHTHEQSEFNHHDQEQLQLRMHRRPFGNWAVLNGGFQVGSASAILKFCKDIYSTSDNAECPYKSSDQAAINYLVRYYGHLWIDGIKTVNPIDHNLILHGEPIHTGVMSFSDYNQFCVFHQWDRTDFRAEILKQYGD